jgi:hypothetical protein
MNILAEIHALCKFQFGKLTSELQLKNCTNQINCHEQNSNSYEVIH